MASRIGSHAETKIGKAADTEKAKQKIKERFLELFKQALKTNPGVSWSIESWGGIRGTHAEYDGRVSPIGYVVWAASGRWPTLINETDYLDELGFGPVSYEIGESCEHVDDEDAGSGSFRSKLLAMV